MSPLSGVTGRRRIARSIRRYERQLRALRADRIPFSRANRLDMMALYAEGISRYEHREPQTQAWGTTADILRAIAASERFQVLTDPDLFDMAGEGFIFVTGAPYREQWEALAVAAARNDRQARARILADLASAAVTEPGVLVLDDIAETELAIADAVLLAGGGAALSQAAECPYSSCHHNAPDEVLPAWRRPSGGYLPARRSGGDVL